MHTLSLQEPLSHDGDHHSHAIRVRGEDFWLERASAHTGVCTSPSHPLPAPLARSPATEDQLPEEARAERQTDWALGDITDQAYPSPGPVLPPDL